MTMNHGVLMSTCWSQNIYFLNSDFFVIGIVNYTLNICLFICTLLMTVRANGTHDCRQVISGLLLDYGFQILEYLGGIL